MPRIAKPTDATPFLKWVGGKRSLLPEIRERYPNGLQTGKITRYVEPFVGGGAVLFDILKKFTLEDVHIIDKNPDLVLCYELIKRDVDILILRLKDHEDCYLPLREEDKKTYFENVRDQFNASTCTHDYTKFDLATVDRVAQIIFLNRTCFNGLFRVNGNGIFNVAHGRQATKIDICREEQLRLVHRALQNVHIKHGDFRDCIDVVDKHTFVYVDPPYIPLNKTSNYTSYTSDKFDMTWQSEVANFCSEVDARGASFVASNSAPDKATEGPPKNIIRELYKGFKIDYVAAPRFINSKKDKRKKIPEVLITNFRYSKNNASQTRNRDNKSK